MSVHPTAIVSPEAKLGKDVVIGPFCIVGKDVTIGDGSVLAANVIINGPTTIGKRNQIWQFCSLGEECQHLLHNGDNGHLIIGDDNKFRESCTLHRGTLEGGGKTCVGNNNYFMVNTHIGHDCMVGDGNVIANNSSLGGHVHLGNYVTLGGHTGVHQHCRIGDYAFIGRCAMVVRDTPPYTKSAGNEHRAFGINSIALQKAGISQQVQSAIKKAYVLFYKRNETPNMALNNQEIIQLCKDYAEVKYFIEFIKVSVRGVVR